MKGEDLWSNLKKHHGLICTQKGLNELSLVMIHSLSLSLAHPRTTKVHKYCQLWLPLSPSKIQSAGFDQRALFRLIEYQGNRAMSENFP
jgi:hypothetical protein